MLKGKEPALFKAIEQNSMKRMEFLLHMGVNVDAEDLNGERAIEILARNQNLEGVKILIKYNADFSVKVKSNREYSKFIPHLVKDSSVELKELVQLETEFNQNDFGLIDILFDIKSSIDEADYEIQMDLDDSREFSNFQPDFSKHIKPIEDFTKLKLEALRVIYTKNDKEALAKYIKKLEVLDKFLEESGYFADKPAKIFLTDIISKYKVNNLLTIENFAELDKLYCEDDVALSGEWVCHKDCVSFDSIIE